jgi:hypothetical protein
MTRPEVSSPSRATRHSLITTEPAPCVGSGPAGRWAHRGVSPSAVGWRMPGSRSGEVAGKAPGIVQVLDQRFAHEHARTQAASRKPQAASREPGAYRSREPGALAMAMALRTSSLFSGMARRRVMRS